MSTHLLANKVCSRCGRSLHRSDLHFGKRRRSTDGFANWCRDCNNEISFLSKASKFGHINGPKRTIKTILDLDLQNRTILIKVLAIPFGSCIVYDILNKSYTQMKVHKLNSKEVIFEWLDKSWTICTPSVDKAIPTVMGLLKQNSYRLEESTDTLAIAINEFFHA